MGGGRPQGNIPDFLNSLTEIRAARILVSKAAERENAYAPVASIGIPDSSGNPPQLRDLVGNFHEKVDPMKDTQIL